MVTCVREHTQTPVADRRCMYLEKPMTQPIRCNVKDCPPHWESHWSPCSTTCGDGIQHYMPQCHQELSTGRSKILTNDAACPKPKPTPQARPCRQEPCENTKDNEVSQNPDGTQQKTKHEWIVGAWSPVSVFYGKNFLEFILSFSVQSHVAQATELVLFLVLVASVILKIVQNMPNTAKMVSARLMRDPPFG